MNDITNLHIRIAPYYTCYRITNMIDEDIKSIKRLNVVLSKMNRNDKDVNTLEAINILKILNNVLDISKMQLIFMELIDIDYHESVLYLISHINDLNVDKMKAVESEVQE